MATLSPQHTAWILPTPDPFSPADPEWHADAALGDVAAALACLDVAESRRARALFVRAAAALDRAAALCSTGVSTTAPRGVA